MGLEGLVTSMDSSKQSKKKGFTLTEVMVSVSISTLVFSTILTTYLTYLGTADYGSVWAEADHEANLAIDKIIKGTDETYGIRAFNLDKITHNSTSSGWYIQDEETLAGYIFSKEKGTISNYKGNILIEDIESSELLFNDKTIYLSVTVKISRGRSETSRHYESTIQPRN